MKLCGLPTCANDLPAGKRKYCSPEHAQEARRASARIPKDDVACQQCGETFTPYHREDTVCDRPECRKLKRREDNRRNHGSGVEVDEPLKDEQMKRPHLDHDHVTKEPRAALCYRCNVGIGFFRDNKHFLLAATRYIQTFQYLRGTPSIDISVEV